MLIRFAVPADIPGIIGLLQQVGQVHHQIRPDLFRANAQKYDETALFALLSDPARPIFAALEGEDLLGYGFCILQEIKNDPVLCDRKTLYIDDLCVDETCRGKGVAKAIFDHICTYARHIRCDAVTLNVWSGNDRAYGFYEKSGMKPQKTGMELIL